MEGYQKRVIDERDELESKLKKLSDFVLTKEYEELSIEEKTRLIRQKLIMNLYTQVLFERIENFKGGESV